MKNKHLAASIKAFDAACIFESYLLIKLNIIWKLPWTGNVKLLDSASAWRHTFSAFNWLGCVEG